MLWYSISLSLWPATKYFRILKTVDLLQKSWLMPFSSLYSIPLVPQTTIRRSRPFGGSPGAVQKSALRKFRSQLSYSSLAVNREKASRFISATAPPIAADAGGRVFFAGPKPAPSPRLEQLVRPRSPNIMYTFTEHRSLKQPRIQLVRNWSLMRHECRIQACPGERGTRVFRSIFRCPWLYP